VLPRPSLLQQGTRLDARWTNCPGGYVPLSISRRISSSEIGLSKYALHALNARPTPHPAIGQTGQK